jgi:hypothetical protein
MLTSAHVNVGRMLLVDTQLVLGLADTTATFAGARA